jgi:serine/threonine-protein phosphatase 2A regulatory subunit B'
VYLLSIIKVNELKDVLTPLFKRLARCMASTHFQVAERALCLWRKKAFLKITRQYLPTILPIVYGPLYTNSKNHWHRSVRVISVNTLRMFMEMDSKLFTQCTEQYRTDFLRAREDRKESERRWAYLMKLVTPNASLENHCNSNDGHASSGSNSSNSNNNNNNNNNDSEEGLRGAGEGPEPQTQEENEDGEDKSRPIRRKSLLPVDVVTIEALHKHVGLDDDSDNETAYADGHRREDQNEENGNNTDEEEDEEEEEDDHDDDEDGEEDDEEVEDEDEDEDEKAGSEEDQSDHSASE